MEKGYTASITGVGSFLPRKVITNDDLTRILDTTDEWITKRTGIKERRIVEDGVAASDLAIEASLRALDDANVSPSEVDIIIAATITPDFLVPTTACLIQEKIGARNAGAFDLLAACAGFVLESWHWQGRYPELLRRAGKRIYELGCVIYDFKSKIVNPKS